MIILNWFCEKQNSRQKCAFFGPMWKIKAYEYGRWEAEFNFKWLIDSNIPNFVNLSHVFFKLILESPKMKLECSENKKIDIFNDLRVPRCDNQFAGNADVTQVTLIAD